MVVAGRFIGGGKATRATWAKVLKTVSILVVAGSALLGARDRVRPALAQEPAPRRVYARHFGADFSWAEAGIFWFGRVDPPGSPGRNYADVRVGYTDEALRVYVNVQDYYVWYDDTATQGSDLTQYDAVAIYVDTDHDREGHPQPDDYIFLRGLGGTSVYRREARGTGSGWDASWQAPWSADNTAASWSCNPGLNSNDCGIDFGWWSMIDIPWTTLELSAPPADGTVWGLGVVLYDRDDEPPAGFVAPEHWPETLNGENPSTWGELAFGRSRYAPQLANSQGATLIRRGLNGTVEDAWVGGGGTCSGGHEGDPDRDNHGTDTSLFVANQYLIADFPCFSKSYLRFDLDTLPRDKTVISATLTVHQWGNAGGGDWDDPRPSLVWLLATDDGWEEQDLTWNNAPLAQENLSATWVHPCVEENPCGPVPYQWDATRAVAEEYSAGEALNIALYSADWDFHSSKYFASSEAEDWIAEARPTLRVTWGEPLATVHKVVSPPALTQGNTVTYTLSLLGAGKPLTLTDQLPPLVGEPGPISVSEEPSVVYDPGAHELTWTGSPSTGHPVTVTFPVTVEVDAPHAIFNTAVLTDSQGNVSTDTAVFIVNPRQLFLPVVLRNS